MVLTWSRQDRPRWDDDKQRIIGGAPPGALDVSYSSGADLPGDWFVAEQGGTAAGFGWIDSTWGGDTEILLAVDAAAQGSGTGSFVLEHLEREAAERGSNYVYNTVRDTHPDRERVHDWLLIRGYQGNDRDASLRKRVGGEPARGRPAASRGTGAGTGAGVVIGHDRPPGHEESGGYVDVEDHQF